MSSYFVGLFFVGLMIFQTIAMALTRSLDWESQALKYRLHQWLAICMAAGVILLFLGGVVLPALTQQTKVAARGDTAKEATKASPKLLGTNSIVDTNALASKSNELANASKPADAHRIEKEVTEKNSVGRVLPYSGVFTVFFLGILRAVLDTQLPKRDRFSTVPRETPTEQVSAALIAGTSAERERPRRRSNLWDVFLLGLLVTLALDFAEEHFRGGESLLVWFKNPVLSESGFLAVLFSALAYLAWIYSLLVRQMTLVDNFSGAVVNRFLLSLSPAVPVQVVLIGPKFAGKSKIMSSVTGIPYERLRDTSSPVLGSFPGSVWVKSPSPWRRLLRRAHVRAHNIAIEPNRRNIGVKCSVIDTPGESLGLHLAAAIHFRTDALALVLNSICLDSLVLSNDETKINSIEDFARIAVREGSKTEGDVDVGLECKKYLTALDTATFGTDKSGATIEALATLYKVHTFCLVIYNFAGLDFNDTAKQKLKKLSTQIGDRFGLPKEHCHYSILEVTRPSQDKITIPAPSEPVTHPKPTSPKPTSASASLEIPRHGSMSAGDEENDDDPKRQYQVNSRNFEDTVVAWAVSN